MQLFEELPKLVSRNLACLHLMAPLGPGQSSNAAVHCATPYSA